MKIRFNIGFRLKTLFAAVALLCCVLAWVAHEGACLRREKLAVASLRLDFSAFVCAVDEPEIYDDPTWDVTESVRGRLYRPVTHVKLSEATIDEDAVSKLEAFRYLAGLEIDKSRFADSVQLDVGAFAHLSDLGISDTIASGHLQGVAALRCIEALSLTRAGIGSTDLQEIAGLHRLVALYLDDSEVDTDDLQALSRLKGLEVLSLRGIDCSGLALAFLSGLPSLKVLDLRETNLGDDAATSIGKCAALEELYLCGNRRITDLGVGRVAQCRHLRVLDLCNTTVTDAGVRELSKLTLLQAIDLRGTCTTPDVDPILERGHVRHDATSGAPR